MTCRKEWLTDLDTNKRSKVRFQDFRSVNAEGIGTITVRRKDGRLAFIQDVLYVPEIKCNLFSLGQLVEKGFSVVMKYQNLKMYDSDQNLILKAPLLRNKTFQVDIKVAEV